MLLSIDKNFSSRQIDSFGELKKDYELISLPLLGFVNAQQNTIHGIYFLQNYC